MKRSLLSLVLVATSIGSQATVTFRPGFSKNTTTTPPTITLSGSISNADLTEIKRILPAARENAKKIFSNLRSGYPNGIIAIELNSTGGDVSSALMIGAIAREEGFNAVIKENHICASSCVFILAGTPYRFVAGKVGIHRPYLPKDTVETPEGQKKQYLKLESSIKNYFSAMNVPTDLYDRMFRIAPEKIVWMSEAELDKYGLSAVDPYYEEADNTKSANSLGISKVEYLKLMLNLKSSCGTNVNIDCFMEQFSKVKQ
jgi:hypothetical protein